MEGREYQGGVGSGETVACLCMWCGKTGAFLKEIRNKPCGNLGREIFCRH